MGQNKIIIVVAAAFLVAVVVGFMIMANFETTEDLPAMNDVSGGELSPETAAILGIEGDTEKDVVATLIGTVKGYKQEVGQIREEKEAYKKQADKLLAMEGRVQERVEHKLVETETRVTQDIVDKYAHMMARLDEAENRLQGVLEETQAALVEVARTRDGNLPVKTVHAESRTVWFYAEGSPSGKKAADDTPLGSVSALLDGGDDRSGQQVFMMAGDEKIPTDGVERMANTENTIGPPEPEPVYTIPENATLTGSTAMTALVGRVPSQGTLVDPYIFKVIIGQANLAANGLELPDVAYAVASGTAVGDWTLGCVRGDIQSLTFVFEDGMIRTVGGTAGGSTRLGTLSDPYGTPCVPGKRISNARNFLAQRLGVVSVQAAAAAIARAQERTSERESLSGDTVKKTVDVTGDAVEYALGKSVSAGAEEVAKWLERRQRREFDVIYVKPGAAVAMHITSQLEIDYDPEGRKLNHGYQRPRHYRALD